MAAPPGPSSTPVRGEGLGSLKSRVLIQGLGFKFRVEGLGFRVEGLGSLFYDAFLGLGLRAFWSWGFYPESARLDIA